MCLEPCVFSFVPATLAFLATIPILVGRHVGKLKGPKWDKWALAAVVGWTVIPPVWFAVELKWHELLLHSGPERLAVLKQNREMATSIWAALAGLSAYLYAIEPKKKRKTEAPKKSP